MELDLICKKAIKVVKEVAAFMLEERARFNQETVQIKGKNDLVSYVDITAEKMLVEGLSKILPDAGFLTEEATTTKENKNLFWIIDPLDGTTNFIHNLPSFGISIALANQEELLVGVVMEPNMDECYYAWKGGGAFCNQKAIKVTSNHKIANCLFGTGFPINNHETISNYLDITKYLVRNSRGVRRFGSASIDLIYTACGRFDAFFEYNLKPWDVAGGAIIVKEAGGHISDFKGGEDWLYGQTIIASNKHIHRNLLSIIEQEYYKS